MIKRKKLQELTIKDNFMFGAVMADEELCREFLEMVLGFPIAKVTVSKEKSFIYHPEYRGIRLDVIAADENNTHYDVEMQVQRKENLPKRSRYYHDQIDMELLAAGVDYDQLPNVYVIFICDYDPFHEKMYKYTFKKTCQEDKELQLQDGSTTIFLNTHGENDEKVSEELICFLKYVRGGGEKDTDVHTDEFVQKLQEAVRNVKINRNMEERYMKLEELIREEREEASAEARAEGRAEGRSEGLAAGRVEELIGNIVSFLADVGEIPETLRVKIQAETDLEILRSYLKKAATSKTIEDFLKSIQS